MSNSIITAEFQGFKNYTIEHSKAVGIALFGNSYAEPGTLTNEELGMLEVEHPGFNVFTY